MNNKTLKIGLIGFGRHTERSMFPNIIANNNTQIVAIADINPERIELAKSKLSNIAYFDDGESLLNSSKDLGLDAVYISMTPELHVTFMEQALENNLHVLVEKPVAVYPQELDKSISLSKEKDLIVAVDTKWRYTKASRLAKDHLFKTLSLKPVVFNLNVTFPTLLDSNLWGLNDSLEITLYDMFIHAFDYMEFWLGDYEVVSSYLKKQQDGKIFVTFILKNKSSYAVLNLIQGSEEYVTNFDCTLEDGSKLTIKNLTDISYLPSTSWLGTEGSLRDESKLVWNQGRLYRGYARAGYSEIWNEFINCIIENKKMETNLTIARKETEVIRKVLNEIVEL